MSEATYARQFLSLLESRPIKLASDYVVDARQLPPNPAYILPRMPRPLSKRSQPTAAASSTGETSAAKQILTITLKPLRATTSVPSPLNLPIPASRASTTSIYDLKVLAAQLTGYAPDKIKILWDRKPIGDTKTVAEVGGSLENITTLEMGVMFVGQPTSTPTAPIDQPVSARPPPAQATSTTDAAAKVNDVSMHDAKDETPVAQGAAGATVLETKEFWDDLQAFILQRTRDEEVAAALGRAFREAWRTGRAR